MRKNYLICRFFRFDLLYVITENNAKLLGWLCFLWLYFTSTCLSITQNLLSPLLCSVITLTTLAFQLGYSNAYTLIFDGKITNHAVAPPLYIRVLPLIQILLLRL